MKLCRVGRKPKPKKTKGNSKMSKTRPYRTNLASKPLSSSVASGGNLITDKENSAVSIIGTFQRGGDGKHLSVVKNGEFPLNSHGSVETG